MRLLFLTLILALAAPLQAAKLEFVGLRSYTQKGLTEAIAGRLDYISKRPATDFRADDAAFLVETYLRQHGLPDATVSWTVASNEKIILKVDEGLAKFLGPITVQGFDQETVQNQFKAPFPESGQKRAFDAEAVESGIARVTALLNADGYWEASLTHKQGTRNKNGEIPFSLDITKGPLFTLATPNLKSSVPPTAELQQTLQNSLGRKATAETIVRIRKRIAESYRQLGYTDINLEMARETEGSRLRLMFSLTPGKKFTVRSFATSGLQKTMPSRIINRFSRLIGKNYDENAANKEIRTLLATGAFNSVRLKSQEADNTELDLTLHLSETKARGYSLALGFGSIEGYIFGARYYDRNLWGQLWNLSAGIEITSLGVLGEIARTDPYYLGRDLSLNNRAFLISRDYDNYDTKQGGITNELSWDIGEHYSVTLGIENSLVSTSSTLPAGLIGPENYFNHRLTFRQTYDRRDDPALPADGWFARFDTALGYVHGDSSVGYLETEAQLSYYRTLGDNTSYALGLRGGVILANGSQENLPIDLRQFLGGANSVRSFPEREMGPNFNGTPLGGSTWWLANAEYNHTLKGPVRWLIFLDAGALDDELEFAAGVGLRVDLPVGPIRLEYGHSLSRDSGEPSGAFHFAIGSTF